LEVLLEIGLIGYIILYLVMESKPGDILEYEEGVNIENQ